MGDMENVGPVKPVPVTKKPEIVALPVPPPKTEVSDAEIEAALQELLHPRNSIGDGCFGCGYGGWWGSNTIANNMHRYKEMLKRILEAARPHQK